MRDLTRLPLPADGWTMRATGGVGASRALDAVPIPPLAGTASVLRALVLAGAAPSLHGERAELDSEWIGQTDWTLTSEIEIPSSARGRHAALVIETIDGPCEIFLGGVLLGMHQSEHFPFEARIPAALRGTRALLELRFTAPVDAVLRWQEKLGARPVNGDWTPFCFARSAACSFGWDWGPRVPSVGFHGARIDCWNDTRVVRLTVSQRWNQDGTVTVRVRPQGDFDAATMHCVVRERTSPKHHPCDALGEVTIRPTHCWTTWDRRADDAETARCWWSAMVGFRDENTGAFKAIATQRFAPRKIELDTSIDAVGRRFRFLLNGAPIFARGANIIPPLFGGAERMDWRRELERYRNTGFNMVRVWGGGIYLPDAFYEMCDELGILVWQDFMFACATYPEDEPFASLIAQEAAHQVQRLSHHPSLALWCGGNEDILAWWSWGWKERLAPGQSWGLRYWTEVLPAAVTAHDSGTPYWTESPYSGSMELHPNDPDHGDRHTWDAEAKLEGYRTILPRFSSEFGHQSPPCWATIVRSCLEEARDPLTMSAAQLIDALALRQKAWGGDAVQYAPFLKERFKEAKSAREYVAQTQHLQARAMSIAMRWLRAGSPRSMGALIWQWNDVWAGHSWSLVDRDGRAKPAWHAVRRACEARVLSIEPIGGFAQGQRGALEVVLSEEAAWMEPARFARSEMNITLERMDFAGSVQQSIELTLRPHSECGLDAATLRARVPSDFLTACDSKCDLLVARVEGDSTIERAVEFLAPDAELLLPQPNLAALDGHDGVLRATCVIREAWFEQSWMGCCAEHPEPTDGERALDAFARRNSWRTLLPGDAFEVPAGMAWWSANHFRKTLA